MHMQGGVEYYYGHGIQFGEPGKTPFGTPLQILDLGCARHGAHAAH